jgi:hypothetical protein
VKNQTLTQEAFESWWSHPVAESFKEFLSKWETSLVEQWKTGNFQSNDPQETQNANAQALGSVKLLRDLQELDFTQIEEVLTDG